MTEDHDSFRFLDNNTELMTIKPDGRFFVRGVEVETDEPIRDALVEFAKGFTSGQREKELSLVAERDHYRTALEAYRGCLLDEHRGDVASRALDNPPSSRKSTQEGNTDGR